MWLWLRGLGRWSERYECNWPLPHTPQPQAHSPQATLSESLGSTKCRVPVFRFRRFSVFVSALSLVWADYSVPRVLVLVCVLIPGRTQFKVDYNISPLMLQQMG